jgi:hypothetical protein
MPRKNSETAAEFHLGASRLAFRLRRTCGVEHLPDEVRLATDVINKAVRSATGK